MNLLVRIVSLVFVALGSGMLLLAAAWTYQGMQGAPQPGDGRSESAWAVAALVPPVLLSFCALVALLAGGCAWLWARRDSRTQQLDDMLPRPYEGFRAT